MKKTLLIAAAALAAGVISSQAQTPVYSQNIVGYVNYTTVGFAPLSNPLEASDPTTGLTNNCITNILQNPYDPVAQIGPLDNSQLYVYNGTKYTVYYFDSNPADAAANSQTFTGITDNQGNFVTAPIITNGAGFYLKFVPASSSSYTNTIVGTVRGCNGSYVSNTVQITSTHLNTLIASGLPVGGGLLTGLQLTNVLLMDVNNSGNILNGTSPLDNSYVQIPNVVGNALHGFTVDYFDSNTNDAIGNSQAFTGITDNQGNFIPEPILPVGATFFLSNGAGANTNWTQVLNLQ